MRPPPPASTRTAHLLPYTALFRSQVMDRLAKIAREERPARRSIGMGVGATQAWHLFQIEFQHVRQPALGRTAAERAQQEPHEQEGRDRRERDQPEDRKSTRLNPSH